MRINCLTIFITIVTFFNVSNSTYAQSDKSYTFNFLEDDVSQLDYILPICDECFHLKPKLQNQCFASTFETLLLRDLHYPINELIANNKGEVVMEIKFSKEGKEPKATVLSSTNEQFKEAALHSVKGLPSFSAAKRKRNYLEVNIIYTFSFDPDTWRSSPAGMVKSHEDYFSNVNGIDSTFFKQACDSCSSARSIYRYFHDTFTYQIDSLLSENNQINTPVSGHVFSKYRIDNEGQFILFENEFENTTSLSHSDLQELLNNISFLKKSNLNFSELEGSEYILLLYFTKTGLSLPNDPNNQQERMPVFPGKCTTILDRNAQAKCTEKAIMTYIGRHTIYPNFAKMTGHQGKVYVEFTVDRTGYVSNVTVIKGVSKAIDNAAIDVISSLPRMNPAMQRGSAVRLKYTIPVNFKLR